MRFAAVEAVEREQDLCDLAPQRVLIAAKPVERVTRQMDQSQVALREVTARIRRGPFVLHDRRQKAGR